MRFTRRCLAAFVAPFTIVVGCSASTDAPKDESQGSPDAATESDAGTSSTPDASTLDAASATDGAGSDGDAGRTGLPRCNSRVVTEASLCIEPIKARPGDSVDLEISIVLPAGCPHTTQSHAELVVPAGMTVTVPPSEKCRIRMQQPASFQWGHLTASAASGCPDKLVAGVDDKLTVQIGAGVSAGTYAITLEDVGLGDNIAESSGGCRGAGAIAGAVIIDP